MRRLFLACDPAPCPRPKTPPGRACNDSDYTKRVRAREGRGVIAWGITTSGLRETVAHEKRARARVGELYETPPGRLTADTCGHCPQLAQVRR